MTIVRGQAIFITKVVVGSQVSLVRPNNTTAYGQGQIWGPATDARFSMTSPAAPADAAIPFFTSCAIQVVQGRPPADTTCGFDLLMFSSQPGTVLGDQATIAFADTDIALLIPNSSEPGQVMNANQGAGIQGQLNTSAGVNGRRILYANGAGSSRNGFLFAPATTFWFYIRTDANTYTPVANETMFFTPTWIYPAVPLNP